MLISRSLSASLSLSLSLALCLSRAPGWCRTMVRVIGLYCISVTILFVLAFLYPSPLSKFCGTRYSSFCQPYLKLRSYRSFCIFDRCCNKSCQFRGPGAVHLVREGQLPKRCSMPAPQRSRNSSLAFLEDFPLRSLCRAMLG